MNVLILQGFAALSGKTIVPFATSGGGKDAIPFDAIAAFFRENL